MSGKPAARITDGVSGGKIVSGSRTVLIGSQGGIACSECPGGVTVGNPVSPSLGVKVLMGEAELDFALPGAMPLVWQRQYSSYVNPAHGAPCGLLGHGWSLPSEMRIELREDACILFAALGRAIAFDPLPEGGSIYSPSEDVWLLRGGPGASWAGQERFGHVSEAVRDDPRSILATNGDARTFWVLGPGAPSSVQAQVQDAAAPAVSYALQYTLDRFGRRQTCERDAWGRVVGIVDGVGRSYRLNLRQLHPARAAQGLWHADSGWRLTGIDLVSDPWVAGADEPVALVRYGYSEAGDLLTVHDRAGRLVREFAWQAHRMTAHRHLGGPRHSYRYESLAPGARVVEHANEEGLTYRFEYAQTDTGRTTRVVDSLQRVDVYRFEGEAGLSRLVEHVRADGTQVRYAYDTAGRMVQAVDPLGRTTRLRYDGEGHLLGKQLPDGTLWSYSHDLATGRLISVSDAAGGVTRFAYDAFGRMTATVLADGSTERNEYPAPEDARMSCDHPVRIVDARGGIRQLAWNHAGQLVRHVDCSGHASEAQYDRWGQRIRHTDALGRSIRYDYDLAGRLGALHQPDGSTTRYRRDAAGRVVQVLAPGDEGPTPGIGFAYDLWGRITRRWNRGLALHFGYDLAGRMVRLTNENGAPMRFAWDAMDRQIQKEGFDGRLQTYRYDAAGQLVEATDGTASSHLSTRYAWDAMSRLAEIHVPATEHAAARIERLQWNAAGQLMAARSYLLGPGQLQALHTEALTERDALGRPVAETQRLYKLGKPADAAYALPPEIEFEHTISHRLDALGHRQSSELQDLGQVDYLMYGAGHLHGLLYDGRNLLDIERDALHREVRRQQVLHASADMLVTQRRWDALGRLEDVEMGRPGRWNALDGGAPHHLVAQLARRHYRYDAAGQLAAVETQGGDRHYRYDPAGRLTGARTTDAEQHWSFDPAGNRLPSPHGRLSQAPEQDADAWFAQVRSQWQGSDFDVLGLREAPQPLPPALEGVPRWHDNRIGHSDDTLYTYDSRGNRTEARCTNGRRLLMHYDGANQLVEAQLFEQTTSLVCNYTYDAHGRRLRKIVKERAHPLAQVRESRTCYGWDGDRLVRTEQWRPGRNKQTTHTIYEPGSFTPMVQLGMEGAAPAGALAALAAQAMDPQARQTLKDAFKDLPPDIRQGMEGRLQPPPGAPPVSSIAVRHYHCDALGTPQALTNERGELVWMARHDPWGNLQEEYNPHDIDQPIRLPGQHHDAETGLHYNRHRYYDPGMGIYVSQDPIGLQGGLHLHQYAANPLEWIDPLGLNPAGCAIGAGAGVWFGGVGAAPGCAIGAGVGTVLVLGAIALGVSGDTPQHGNTAAKTDPWGVPIDPKADSLSQAQKNAISRTSPGYGGNCSPDNYDKLHDDYKQKCGQADALGACKSGMSPSQLSARRQAFGQCARAREEMMNQCFAGGDYNHREQAGNVWNAYKNCAGTP